MHEPSRHIRTTSLVSGAVLVASGSAAALWLPGGLAGALALFLLLRICWLEENIRSDLMGASDLPEAYRLTQEVQRRWQRALFGVAAAPETCPRRLASAMRVQSHALYALLIGGFAVIVAQAAAAAPLMCVLLGGALLARAFARVDRLAEAEAILATGAALPKPLLEDRGPLARFVLNQEPCGPDPVGAALRRGGMRTAARAGGDARERGQLAEADGPSALRPLRMSMA